MFLEIITRCSNLKIHFKKIIQIIIYLSQFITKIINTVYLIKKNFSAQIINYLIIN